METKTVRLIGTAGLGVLENLESQIVKQDIQRYPIPQFFRLLIRMKQISKGIIPLEFESRFEELDAAIQDDLKKIYHKEIQYWKRRIADLKESWNERAQKEQANIWMRINILVALFGIGGAVALVNVFDFYWAWGILIFYGVGGLTAVISNLILSARENLRQFTATKEDRDLLFVISLLKVCSVVVQENSENPESMSSDEERKEEIIHELTEGAKWLQYLPSPLPKKYKVLNNWYHTQMSEAANELLTLRHEVMMSKSGCTPEMRVKLMSYLDAALRRDYGKLINKEVEPSKKSLWDKSKRAIGWIFTLVIVLAIVVLIWKNVPDGKWTTETIASLVGTCAALLVSLFNLTGAKQLLGDMDTNIKGFNSIASNIRGQ